MIFGVTTAKAHLNQLDGMYPAIPSQGVPGFAAELEALDDKTRAEREIRNWFIFAPFAVASGQPVFAGRYFCGQPTQAEVDTDEAFCLWAHGEGGGSDTEIPKKIFPIQRANPIWQAATGSDAKTLAQLEANATLDHMEAAFRAGDLWFPSDGSPRIVYLEAAPGKLTGHYWRHWANAILARRMSHPDFGDASPFVPGLICDFEERQPEGDYWPEEAVRNALGAEPIEDPAGARDENTKRYLLQPDCFSLWARKMPRDASIVPLFAIEWFSRDVEVPIHFVRVWDGNEDPLPTDVLAPSEEEAQHVSLVTLDLVRDEVTEDMTRYALSVNEFYKVHSPAPSDDDWHNGTIEIPTKPNMIGLDHVASHGRDVYELASQTPVNLHLVPDGQRGTDYSAHPIELPPVFTGRYLPPRGGGGMSPNEAKDIAAGELDVVSIYQQAADPTGTNDPPPGEPGGRNRMSNASIRQAFENAMAAGQPAFTPIYFAMDVDVDGENHQPSEWRVIPDPAGGPDQVIKDGPDFAAAFAFYRRVRRVYVEDYITQPGAVPYYIGAYGPTKLLHALYRGGLATHFWLIAAWSFGQPVGARTSQAAFDSWFFNSPGWRAWPHSNLWQIRLASAGTHGFWDRTALNDPPFPDPNDPLLEVSWCDINVSWGDPGGWRPTETKIPVLPVVEDTP